MKFSSLDFANCVDFSDGGDEQVLVILTSGDWVLVKRVTYAERREWLREHGWLDDVGITCDEE